MKKILIVDSDQQVTAILELKLKQANFEVKILSRTVNALNVLKEYRPDLIISEMVLPELSGVDFLKRVKMNPATSSTPFFFLSSSRNVEDKILAHEMGAEAFFMKPIFIKVLIQRIKDFFEQANFNEMLSHTTDKIEYKGDITNISLIDILNIINENKSTGTVSFERSTGEKAQIYFSNGSATRIETEGSENRNGEEEMYKLLSWLDGTFVMRYKEVDVRRNVRTPHDSLIVKAVNWLDDYTGELSEMPPLDTKLYLDFAKFISGINKFPDRVSDIIKNIGTEGSRLSDIIDRTDLDRKQTVSYLKKLLEQDIVTIEKKDTEFILPKKPDWLEPDSKEEASLEKVDDFLEKLTPPEEKNDHSKEENKEKTIVPPPSFIEKDTIDPAVGISLDPGTKKAPGPGMIDSASLDFAAEEIPPASEQKTKTDEEKLPPEKIEEVKNEEELKTILDSHYSDIKMEDQKQKSRVFPENSRTERKISKRVVFLFLLFFIIGGLAVTHIYFPEKLHVFANILRSLTDNEVAETDDKNIVAGENRQQAEPVVKEETKETVLSDKQKALLNEPVETLVDSAAVLYEKEKVKEAVSINEVAFYKLKESGDTESEIYEKVVTNMAIYLYMLDQGEEALEFAKESMDLREDSKAIELQVAILDLLGRKTEAAALLRSKLEKPEYTEKKEEWVREINRLEKLEQ